MNSRTHASHIHSFVHSFMHSFLLSFNRVIWYRFASWCCCWYYDSIKILCVANQLDENSMNRNKCWIVVDADTPICLPKPILLGISTVPIQFLIYNFTSFNLVGKRFLLFSDQIILLAKFVPLQRHTYTYTFTCIHPSTLIVIVIVDIIWCDEYRKYFC